MSDFQFFLPIAKIDEKKRTVSGYASTPTKDSDGEIVTLEAIRDALPGYMEFGNIREMHALKAVGVANEANIDTTGLYLTAKIVDDAAWKKCQEKVYKGFSIGGRKLAKEGEKITKIDLSEISVVDRPANPDCRITVAKAHKGADIAGAEAYLLKVKTPKTQEAKALAKMAKVVGILAKDGPPAAHDGLSLPAKKAETRNSSPIDDATQNNKAEGAEPSPGLPAPPEKKLDPEAASQAKAERKAKKKAKKLKAAKKMAKRRQFLAALNIEEPSFLILKKSAPVIDEEGAFLDLVPSDLGKSMNTAGSLAYVFDSIRGAQRSLLMEGNREGGDKKDQQLAKQLGDIAKKLAAIISQKAEHEGEEALSLTDADDTYLSSILGEDFKMATNTNGTEAAIRTGDPLTDALALMMKKAATPTKAARLAMAKAETEKAREAMKECKKLLKALHGMHKASYLSKAKKAGGKEAKPTDDADGEFDHTGAMEKLQKAFDAANKARMFSKSATGNIEKAIAGRSGQRGEDVSDADPGFYEVPAGVKALTPSHLAGADPGDPGVGSVAPMYPDAGQVYPGKADAGGDLRKFAGPDGRIPAATMELLLQKARSEGELEALRKMPAAAAGRGARPFSFDVTKAVGGTSPADTANLNKALFDGVNVAAIGSGDERAHQEAAAKVLGNFLTSGQFGKSVLDPTFRGAAGSGR
jgi:phage head maturation protease